MSLEAVRAFLAADDARERMRLASSTATDAATVAAQTAAREVEDDGGLVAYAERLARRRYPAKARGMAHLAPIAAKLEEAERAMRREAEPVFAVTHGPVQHGKSSLFQSFVARTLKRNPFARIGYIAFNADRATEKMWEVRELAAGEGIRLHPSFNTKAEWRTVEGGYVRAGGIFDGKWTGGDFDVLLCDDLYAGPSEAESAAHRYKLERTFETVLETRGQGRTSIVVDMARWNPLDISGVLIRRGWEYVCIPAIDERGCASCVATSRGGGPLPAELHTCRALWPDVYPLAVLLAKRDGRAASPGRPAILPMARRTWAAMYQGRPVADGARVFDPALLKFYDRLPDGPFFEALGIDVAYGAKARNDRSAIVAFRRYFEQPRDLFMAEAWLGHEAVELFACRTAATQIRRAGGPRLLLPESAGDIEAVWDPVIKAHGRARRVATLWYASGTEAGAAGIFRAYGANVSVMNAGIDKLARAQGGYVDPNLGGYTSTWSEGRVWWPAEEGEHATALRIQHEDFTGAPSDDDDGVDAAVAGHDAIQARELLEMQAEHERARAQSYARGIPAGRPHHPLGVAPRAPRI